MDDTEWELVSKYKYLGFFIDEHMDIMDVGDGINFVCEAARRRLNGIRLEILCISTCATWKSK